MARVLVVDSDEDASNALAGVLEGAGHRVRVSYLGEGSDELASALRSEVVVVARRLADMDGFKVLCRLKEQRATAATPVVMLMDGQEMGDVAAACALGASDWVTGARQASDAAERVGWALSAAALAGRTGLGSAWRRPVHDSDEHCTPLAA
jgi:two-component system alkaline phosphatase synthesis response regulator PhoP